LLPPAGWCDHLLIFFRPTRTLVVLASFGAALVAASGAARANKRAERPECGTMKYFGEGISAGLDDLFLKAERVFDLIVPDVGAERTWPAGGALVLSWPLTVSFGEPTATMVRRYHCAEDVVYAMQPHRLTLEPGVSLELDTPPSTYWVRPAYGYVWHEAESRWGYGVGLGPTVRLRASKVTTAASPEVSLRYGYCCRPMYLVLALRYEVALASNLEQTVLFKVGFSYR
jgi:hypothetical protein